MEEIKFKPIGIIHSIFKKPDGTPIQSTASKASMGWVEVFKDYESGLKYLDGFSHIILIYYFHLVKKKSLKVKPFMDNKLRGIFATRAPKRPNPIGISIVKLEKIEGNIIYIKDLDILDGTPLLDIKPYVPKFDTRRGAKIGWLEKNIKKLEKIKDDGRFIR